MEDFIASGIHDLSISKVLKWAASTVMIFGGVVPFIPQYREIRRKGDAEGFSLYVCLKPFLEFLLEAFLSTVYFQMVWKNIEEFRKPSYAGPKLNILPDHLKINSGQKCFKKKLQEWFLQWTFYSLEEFINWRNH
ncbi:PQ-loop repeat-containing protein 1 [Homalodisca vitripennis]|nr:PQ-loop repeat-containing protein 1 [Homalodisca vitripennis]